MTPDISEITTFVRARISERTKVPESEIVDSTVLVDIGLESVDAVLICGEIEDAFQVEVEPSMMFEHERFGEVITAVMALFATR
jgi:acyl carrier protein